MGTKRKGVLAGGMDVSQHLAIKREMDTEYMQTYHVKMLARFKNDKVMRVNGNKAFEPYFGKTYSALYNTIPVTIKFDGTDQFFPETVATWLQDKIFRVIEANTSTVQNDELTH